MDNLESPVSGHLTDMEGGFPGIFSSLIRRGGAPSGAAGFIANEICGTYSSFSY